MALVLSVDILLANVVESAFNDIAVFSVFVLLVIIESFCDFVYTSVEFAFNPIDVLSVDILLDNVAESAFNAIAVLRVFVLLVNIKSFCDFVYI